MGHYTSELDYQKKKASENVFENNIFSDKNIDKQLETIDKKLKELESIDTKPLIVKK